MTIDDWKDRALKAEALLEEAVNGLESIVQWSDAYPLDVFPEPDFARAAEALRGAGITLDAVSASNMRHVVNGVGQTARATLTAITGGK